jgi:hypothetical protein
MNEPVAVCARLYEPGVGMTPLRDRREVRMQEWLSTEQYHMTRTIYVPEVFEYPLNLTEWNSLWTLQSLTMETVLAAEVALIK